MNRYYPEIRQYIDTIAIIDTHEHQIEENLRLGMNLDFGVLMNMYANFSLMCAGMSQADMEFVVGEGGDTGEKWNKIEPYWDFVRHADYMQAYLISIDKAYGIKELNKDSCLVLTKMIREQNKPGIVRKLIRDVAGVDKCVVNSIQPDIVFRKDTDKEIFAQELGFGRWFGTVNFPFDDIKKDTGITLGNLDDLCSAIDWYFNEYASRAASVKVQSAYFRTLLFEPVSRQEAEESFQYFLNNPKTTDMPKVIPFQNFMMDHLLQRCADYKMPMRYHTGYLAGLNYMDPPLVDPTLLTITFKRYPNVRYSLFHIGYPYQNELVALAKHYANVYIDLCWAWIIDYEATKQFLKQYIHAVPTNKIFGFGGDYLLADTVVGHLEIAKRGIAQALSELVDEGFLSIPDAKGIADRMLRKNALEFFNFA